MLTIDRHRMLSWLIEHQQPWVIAWEQGSRRGLMKGKKIAPDKSHEVASTRIRFNVSPNLPQLHLRETWNECVFSDFHLTNRSTFVAERPRVRSEV